MKYCKLELQEAVRVLRLAKDWSMRELSERAGIARVTIWTIEAGTKGVSLVTANKLAKAFGIRLGALILLSQELVEKELQIIMLQDEMKHMALLALKKRQRKK